MTETEQRPIKYEIYAIRYAVNTRRRRSQNFILDASPTELLQLDFYSWLIVGGGRSIVVDTGMDAAKGAQNGHETLLSPVDMLKTLGCDPATADTVILTHAHYDHLGHLAAFPEARFLMQAEEMNYVTGPWMGKPWFRHAYKADEIARLVHLLHDGRLELHGREKTIADGVSVHWVGGHCAGQEVVRVRTARGWVVLASDASHFYANLEQARPFPIVHDLGAMLDGYRRLRDLATSEAHIVPGHDPAVMARYPAARPGLEDWVVRLDLAPTA
jgi:glyoxylase-like metal-dependent hydrolase (beta-lactamase superfamily II)